MALFWQLSGPQSHLKRSWKSGKHTGNAEIAEDIFNALAMKCEDGLGLELVFGIEESGASQILIPVAYRERCRYLNWGDMGAYPASKYASLSPIRVDTHMRLQMLLDERQNISKVTKASKKKGDTSKANGRFWNGPPNLARAAFEHSRCFWSILQNKLQPRTYGLPEAPWRRHVTIFSLALNFWTPDGTRPTNKLIDASLTKLSTHSIQDGDALASSTWYFVATENQGLQNCSQAKEAIVSEAWNAETLPQAEIGPQIWNLLKSHSRNQDNQQVPLILLVHDYPTVKLHLETLGLANSDWVFEIKQLLGFHDYGHGCKEEQHSFSRTRSCSPHDDHSFTTFSSRRRHSPILQRSYAPIYVIDTVMMFKTMTGSGEHPRHIQPTAIYNVVTGLCECDTGCAGNDSNYILHSWKGMVQGPCIDEQRMFFEEYSYSTPWPTQSSSLHVTGSKAAEADGLYDVQKEKYADAFNDGSDSEEW